MKPGLSITAGSLHGQKVRAAAGIRPTAARLRESLMSIWMERLPGARFLELFAGSGVVGLEAVSRGVEAAVLVEGDRGVHRVLRENCARLAPEAATSMLLTLPLGPADARRRIGREFDLVFADPPYDFELYGELLAMIAAVLGTTGQAAIEHAEGLTMPLPAGVVLDDQRRYGDSALSFVARDSGAQF